MHLSDGAGKINTLHKLPWIGRVETTRIGLRLRIDRVGSEKRPGKRLFVARGAEQGEASCDTEQKARSTRHRLWP